MIEEITAWIRRQVDEDEWWAREASRTRGQEGIPEGEHWQWVNPNSDEPIDIEPTAEDYVYGSLRSVEEYPTDSVGPLPSFVISEAEEVPMVVAGYIARRDPADTLAEVRTTRRILDSIPDWQRNMGDADYFGSEFGELVKLMALRYEHRDGYDERWRPLADRSSIDVEAQP